ncbi:hypothetical protein N7462_009401 [Penicillium macrosclerotiorum]|uniref:uncharacterized protein n=1 Tax=Penicillium macrosclerotiorum TaxID=303699 RepID=UPI0025493B11|nr:uncharacterized protein N7462_009401 [Penicillium macrosclerotiorum]KAJ5673962.1 hypothetical protein N7462_009401 [Penicillium macrosclerotiorum]
MIAPLPPIQSTQKVALFGPQFLYLRNGDSYEQLRRAITQDATYQWVIQTVSEMPETWQTISQRVPAVQSLSGRKMIQKFAVWLETGHLDAAISPMPNLLLTPMVVMSQICQYLRYNASIASGAGPAVDLDRTPVTQTIGLCIGLLSALAVASASDETEIRIQGAKAVRLAMLIGAIVDAYEECLEPEMSAVSFSTAYASPNPNTEEVLKIIEQVPEAYVSVVYDLNRLTVTTSQENASSLSQQLSAAGVKVTRIGLQGRFHSRVYESLLSDVIQFCDSEPKFQLADASALVLRTRSNSGPKPITSGKLHQIALKSILVDPSCWYDTCSSLLSTSGLGSSSDLSIVSFGTHPSMPPSLMQELSNVVTHYDNIGSSMGPGPRHFEHDIAVVGMAIKTPGADDVNEFWELLRRGESQHQRVPHERLSFETPWREGDSKQEWFGNFIDDPEAFDHKFFKKSPRESASMDPQQRLLLQVAYQAAQQAGYFRTDIYGSKDMDQKRVGCFVGVSNVDYQDNIACHPANAYSATGTLMSFVAGKISHYFGWTGPAMSIDTACSGSAVAIHQACKALLADECTAALAGGVNIMTGPLWFQNLAGASFLSTTGQCKPFDASGDGYCRGEASGAVFLKRLSRAQADGDNILGVIAGSAVFQNQNETPITVPNSASLSDLFLSVTRRAHVEPGQITVVEAHGTGTAVGDPAEYSSIRQVFGGAVRRNLLSLGSVKGLVGHAECASGMVALIKILLMLHHGEIPPQASFHSMRPSLNAAQSDMINISTTLKPWDSSFKAALINNYGASGSNASMVITQAPASPSSNREKLGGNDCKYPFSICALDDRSVRAYAVQLLSYVQGGTRNLSLADVAFNLSRQSNLSLPCTYSFAANSLSDLSKSLTEIARQSSELSPPSIVVSTTAAPSRLPIILCFGGQVFKFIGLDRKVYEEIALLRSYLDRCDGICQDLGLPSIYPGIFQQSPIDDIVALHISLFSLQYSCAKCWIDCGIPVQGVVGHSFGEYSALTIAGVMSLRDALVVISARARVIDNSWSTEKGAMAAVEGDLEVVQQLLVHASKVNPQDHVPTIACFNGDRSFTVAGSSKSIDAVVETHARDPIFAKSMRIKRLNVTHAFHSMLVDPLKDELEKCAQSIVFHPPTIPVERATEHECSDFLTPRFVADHLRNPVYFNHAVQRITRRHPSAVWLEAGSMSTITAMANRAQGMSSSKHIFQSINITGAANAWPNLVQATIDLRKNGVMATFWAHHSCQASSYSPLLLPPYQFEKAKHWLELKKPEQLSLGSSLSQGLRENITPKELWSFVGYQDPSLKTLARFRINTETEKFRKFVSGHTVAHSAPLCPSTLQLDMAIECILYLCPELLPSNMQPELQGLENHAPLCIDISRQVWLDIQRRSDDEGMVWDWKLVSNSAVLASSASDEITNLHASGTILFRSRDDVHLQTEFERYERLVGYNRCQSLLHCPDDVDDAIVGRRNIYKTFAHVVDYGEIYQGVCKVVGKGKESAGRVVKQYTGETWLDTPLCDSFCQVAGVYVNCMTNHPDAEVCISNKIERLIRSPRLDLSESRPDEYHIIAVHHQPSPKLYSSDVFIFDPRSGALMEVILGIQYQKVNRFALGKVLARLTPGFKQKEPVVDIKSIATEEESTPPYTTSREKETVQKSPGNEGLNSTAPGNLHGKIRNLIAQVCGRDLHEIQDSASLADLGIDSLMGMELARDIENAFKCTLNAGDLITLTDIKSLLDCIDAALGGAGGAARTESSTSSSSSSSSTSSSSATSSPTGVMTPCLSASSKIDQQCDDKDASTRYAAHSQETIDAYVLKYTQGFLPPPSLASKGVPVRSPPGTTGHCVLLTGATGSLGSHLAAHLTKLSNVQTVICLNRPGRLVVAAPMDRQEEAFTSRGISLDLTALSKVRVLEADITKPRLGLSDREYEELVSTVSHIVHNAWPMTITRPVKGFEPQFQTLRNLIDLAHDIVVCRAQLLQPSLVVGFQFISSIATVGLHPIWTGNPTVPEAPMTVDSVLESGYGEAKLVCETMLQKTLQQYPECFRAMVMRIGQIAGSKKSGYWNPVEHFSFLIKSSVTLKVFPDLQGVRICFFSPIYYFFAYESAPL